jgi:hypothetical protein
MTNKKCPKCNGELLRIAQSLDFQCVECEEVFFKVLLIGEEKKKKTIERIN